MAKIIETKLKSHFVIESLNIIDESHLHQGHGGWREGGESHFRLLITSSELMALPRLERHRRVNECLKDELAASIHALSLKFQ